MKSTITLLAVLTASIALSQSMPLDFEVPEDAAFAGVNGTSPSVIVDPADASNMVLELAGAGQPFDGAALGLDTFVDLSDDATNVVTLEVWSPVSTTRTHLLKFEGSASGINIEEQFTTTAAGWQTVAVDFPSGAQADYTTIVLFTDFNNSDNGTFLFDDISAPNGAVIPGTPTPAIAAPTPSGMDMDVFVLYGDTGGFTNLWIPDYSFGSDQGEVDLDTGSVNNARRFNLSVAGYGEGLDPNLAPQDVTQYDTFRFDYWADTKSTEFSFFLIENDGSTQEYTYQIALTGGDATLVQGAWTSVEIPMSFFTAQGFSPDKFFQWKIDASSDLVSDFVYLDNALFSVGTTIGVNDLELTSIRVFPNPSSSTWSVVTDNATIQNIQLVDLQGRMVLSSAPNATTARIDGSELAPGVYLCQIETNSGFKMIRLVKN